jgi:cell division protein FtsL
VFWILTAAVVTSMILGVVSLSAMQVQGGFQVDDMQARIADLNERSQMLPLDVAQMSAPARVAAWARAQGMVTPDRAVVIRARPQGDA